MAPIPLLAAFAALIPSVAVPDSSFVLTKVHGDTVAVMNLRCEPAGGNHPRAALACDVLSPVRGEVGDLTEAAIACTLEYDPVTVTATGRWRGESRGFTQRYPNRCAMTAATGPVFDF